MGKEMKQERKIKISALLDQIYQNARDMGIVEVHAGKHKDIIFHKPPEEVAETYKNWTEEAMQELCSLLGMRDFGPRYNEENENKED